jgi:hypothetical protein
MQKFYTLICTLVLLLSMTFMAPVSALAADYTPVVTENEISVFLETSYDNAKIWAWNDKVGQFTTAAWPGDAMTKMGTKDGKNVFKWTYTVGTEIPTGVIFTHDGLFFRKERLGTINFERSSAFYKTSKTKYFTRFWE